MNASKKNSSAAGKTYCGETILGNFKRMLQNLSEIITKRDKIIVCGDFNADPNKDCPKSKCLDLWKTDHALDQIIDTDTHVRLVQDDVQHLMLDLVFHKEIDGITAEVFPTEMSDHHLVLVTTPAMIKPQIMFQKMVVTDWRRFDCNRMSELIKENLKGVSLCESINATDADISHAIIQSMNVLTPPLGYPHTKIYRHRKQ
jgi:hypothetical protein